MSCSSPKISDLGALPFIPGSEIAGTVRSVGPGVTQWRIGDRVTGSALVGAFAQQVALPVTSLGRSLTASNSGSAAAGVAHRTAYHALRTMGGVTAGDQVVVLGARAGVGLAAVELAVVLGATVTAVASSQSKRGLCVAKGAGTAIDSMPRTSRSNSRRPPTEALTWWLTPSAARTPKPRSAGRAGAVDSSPSASPQVRSHAYR